MLVIAMAVDKQGTGATRPVTTLIRIVTLNNVKMAWNDL
jgi:hypothetical protein